MDRLPGKVHPPSWRRIKTDINLTALISSVVLARLLVFLWSMNAFTRQLQYDENEFTLSWFVSDCLKIDIITYLTLEAERIKIFAKSLLSWGRAFTISHFDTFTFSFILSYTFTSTTTGLSLAHTLTHSNNHRFSL